MMARWSRSVELAPREGGGHEVHTREATAKWVAITSMGATHATGSVWAAVEYGKGRLGSRLLEDIGSELCRLARRLAISAYLRMRSVRSFEPGRFGVWVSALEAFDVVLKLGGLGIKILSISNQICTAREMSWIHRDLRSEAAKTCKKY